MTIAEKQLGQSRPANTTAATLYSPGSGVTAVIKSLIVCNVSASLAKFRVFQDDDGTTYDESTALFWDADIKAGESMVLDNFAPMNNSSGGFGVRTSIANAITFTLSGAEIT